MIFSIFNRGLKFILALLILSSYLKAEEGLALDKDQRAWIQKHQEVDFTGDPNWLPFEAFDQEGNYIGIVAEYLELITQKSGLKFRKQRVDSWSEALTLARESKVKVISGDSADKVLNRTFKPIEPYLISPIVIVMSEHANYVEAVEELKDKKVAVIKDYGYTAELFKQYPTMKFIEVANIQEGLNQVSEGELDALLASDQLVRYSIASMGLDHVKIVGKTSVVMEVTLFVAKDEPLLYKIINDAVKSISTRQQQSIINLWQHDLHTHDTTHLPLWAVLLFTVTVIVLFIFTYMRFETIQGRYKYALAGSNDAIWHWNIQKNSIYFSPRFKEILGYTHKEFPNEISAWTQRVHPDDKGAVVELIENNLQGKSRDSYILEHRMLHKDGTWRWLRLRAKSFYDTQGHPLRMDGLCKDITKEKELSVELARSQQLLTKIIDNIPVRVFWKDLEGRYLGCNKLFAHDAGATESQDIIGKHDFDMPWKNEAQKYLDDDRFVIRTGSPKLNYEDQQTTPEGQKIWLSTSKVPLTDERGEVVGLLGAYYDITSVKEHQIENEKKTKFLESAQELGHLGSWEWNISTGELRWSDEVYRIFGEKPQSFPATYEAFKSYIPEEYHEGLEKAINDAMTYKKPYEYDHEVRRKDGALRLVREAGYVQFNEKGEPILMLGTVLDINSVVEAKSTRRQYKELQDLLQKFDQNVIASNTDLKGRITYASEAFSKVSGYSNEELMGSPQSIVRHPDMPNEIFKDMWETIEAGHIWSGEVKNRRKDGKAYWVKNTISPIFNDDKEIVGYSAIRRDITHEKQVEELHKSLEKKSQELLSLNRGLERRIKDAVLDSKHKDHLMAQQSKLASMGEMIGNIAHQWRQPLNALGLLLQKQQVFFDRGLLTSEKLKESIEKGTSLIKKMSTTIDDFRDFFKPNKEKVDFDIKESVDDTMELIDAALYNQNITIDIDLEANTQIYGYKNEFSQVILNLVSNAKDVLVSKEKKDANIKLHSYKEGSDIKIEVSDNGGGIPEDVLEHIFEPYFTTKEEGQGTGIGLYMSKMIIEENMGGSLTVNNGKEGAVFTIALPLKQESEAVESAAG